MSDAAAFFANKKKKKKTFKFNANKIDAASVETKVHVDAPALSTDADAGSSAAAEGASASLPISSSSAAAADGGADSQWDDAALAAATGRKGTKVAAPAGATTKDWADLKALDFKTTGNEQDDIAKKLRVEETRAQLAAAKEGMEREAQRIKEEKEKKEQGAKEKTSSNRFGAAAAGMSGGAGGKWVPSRMRAGGMSMSDRFGGSGMGSQKLDTEDENLFPDLASADKIMEQKKSEQPAFAAPKKTPVGGGASWGARPKLNLKPKTQTAKDDAVQPAAVAEEPKQESKPAAEEAPKQEAAAPAETKEEAAPPAATEPAPATSTAAGPAPASIKPKKKKKKDISTFGKK